MTALSRCPWVVLQRVEVQDARWRSRCGDHRLRLEIGAVPVCQWSRPRPWAVFTAWTQQAPGKANNEQAPVTTTQAGHKGAHKLEIHCVLATVINFKETLPVPIGA